MQAVVLGLTVVGHQFLLVADSRLAWAFAGGPPQWPFCSGSMSVFSMYPFGGTVSDSQR